jgi:hypothetical protein
MLRLLTVLYMLSVGPACWLADWNLVPRKMVREAFQPLARIGFATGDIQFERGLIWYGKLFSPPDRYDSPLPLPYRYWETPTVERLASDARPDPVWEELMRRRSSRRRWRR